MRKLLSALLIFVSLAACGGGSSVSTTPTNNTQKLSFYGSPLGSTPTTQTASFSFISEAVADTPMDDTVLSLQQALAANGVTATVTPQAGTATELHALIMGTDGGLPPTNDQFKTDLNSWVVANYQPDDTITPMAQQTAALAQFQQDVTTFIERMHVAGKQVWMVLPVPTCDYPAGWTATGQYTAADGAILAIQGAAAAAGGQATGGFPQSYVNTINPDGSTTVTNVTTEGHMGADCRTPDAYILNLRTNLMAQNIAQGLAEVSAPVAASTPATQ